VTITAAADGSALGNPGPAGWAWYVDDACWAAGGWKPATNNRGELQAVLELLRATADTGDDLRILCDSQYVINSLTKWMTGWKRKGWKKSDGKDVLNRDLMEQLDEALQAARADNRSVDFEWVKGHNNHELNEAADARARGAAEAFKKGVEPATGPGFTDAGGAGGSRSSGAPSDRSAAADELTTVACKLPTSHADAIVAAARTAGHSAQDELASLIALGMERKYHSQ